MLIRLKNGDEYKCYGTITFDDKEYKITFLLYRSLGIMPIITVAVKDIYEITLL